MRGDIEANGDAVVFPREAGGDAGEVELLGDGEQRERVSESAARARDDAL